MTCSVVRWPLSLASVLAAGLVAGAGCSPAQRLEFILCPDDVHGAMVRVADLGQKRELLFPLDYEVVVVEQRGGMVSPATVLRAGHSGGPARPAPSSLAEPTHVSDYFILEPPTVVTGIAIRRAGESAYRVQWLTESELGAARTTAVVHLHPLASLPLLPS